MARKKQDIILENVTIEAVAAEGKALARIDGTVLFVQFAVPGDVVDVKVTKKKKNYMEGFILRMVKPSEHRLEPFCKHFGICGGCKWQPLPYELQLQAKQQQVYDQLVRIGHLDVPEISPIVPSDDTQYYRNKLEFTFSQRRWIFENEDAEALTEQEKYGLGFHVGRFFDKVLDIDHCYLQPEPSNAIRSFIKSYALEKGLTFFNIREHEGFLRNMIIRTTQEGNVMLILCFYHEDATDYPEVGVMSRCFTAVPGSETWANKKLAGVKVDPLTETQFIVLRNKNVNTFERFRNMSLTQTGKVSAGEWIDVIRFRDWLAEEIKVNVLNVIVNNEKVPYTDSGIAIIEGAIRQSLRQGQVNGGIAPVEYDEDGNKNLGYTVEVPLASNISANQKASRILTDVKFTARLSGAIHVVEIRGSLTYENLIVGGN